MDSTVQNNRMLAQLMERLVKSPGRLADDIFVPLIQPPYVENLQAARRRIGVG
jgi:hypothetical protein